jgi:hypothetical protein
MMDMAKTHDEVKEESKPLSIDDTVQKYPYGLCISLDEDQLDKLDMEKPDVGDFIHVFGMARVTSVSEHEKSNGDACCRVELQITHLGLENEDEEEGDSDD